MKGSRPPRAAVLAALVAVGCSFAPERPILDQFFTLSRLRDKTALASVSTIIFEPLTQGIVTTFEVVGVETAAVRGAGEVVAKDVTVTAPVKLPDGRIVDKTLIVRMERSESGWKITAVTM